MKSILTTMIARKAECEKEIENLNNHMNAAVQRVLRLFKDADYSGNTKASYEAGSARCALFGGHLWPVYFDVFEIEDDGTLSASGMYSGARGYYEQESVRFPAVWLDLPEDNVKAAMQMAWASVLESRVQAENVRKGRIEATERAQYEKLREKFG